MVEQEDGERWRSTRTDSLMPPGPGGHRGRVLGAAGSCVACSLQQGMQASEEEEEGEVHWEPMQLATHPVFAILQYCFPCSPARQHPQDRSDGCMSQGWA